MNIEQQKRHLHKTLDSMSHTMRQALTDLNIEAGLMREQIDALTDRELENDKTANSIDFSKLPPAN